MSKPQVVIAVYRPKPGKISALDALIQRHFPTLERYGLTSSQKPYIGRTDDGMIVEIFEWASAEAARKAHDHPAVAKIWEAMAVVSEFGTLQHLPNASKPFPHFERAF
jgi:hypothetical protein